MRREQELLHRITVFDHERDVETLRNATCRIRCAGTGGCMQLTRECLIRLETGLALHPDVHQHQLPGQPYREPRGVPCRSQAVI